MIILPNATLMHGGCFPFSTPHYGNMFENYGTLKLIWLEVVFWFDKRFCSSYFQHELFVAQEIEGMVDLALEDIDIAFFPADFFPSCYLLLAVKTEVGSCKYLSDKIFLNTVAFSTALIEKTLSDIVRSRRNKSLA